MVDIHLDSNPRCICICFPWSCKIKRVSPPPPPVDQSPAAALVIQKSYRGFLVRKDLRTVRIIAAEAEDIAREAVILSDEGERKRLVGMLSVLQLRLQSVRDVNEYRNRVIRQVVQLQKAVEAGETVEPLPKREIRSPQMAEGTSTSAPATIQTGEQLMSHATDMTSRLAQQVERLELAVQRMEQQEGKGNLATC